MEQSNKHKEQNDPTFLSEQANRKELIGRHYTNKLQFEEAVRKLKEEFERYPTPPNGIYY
jgi:hypothetical protein